MINYVYINVYINLKIVGTLFFFILSTFADILFYIPLKLLKKFTRHRFSAKQ